MESEMSYNEIIEFTVIANTKVQGLLVEEKLR